MKKIIITSAFLVSIFSANQAQDKVWSLNDCMEYAIENSPKVKIKQYEKDSYQADYIGAIGAVMPSIVPGTSVNWNYGRNVNPKDNTYQNTTTFYNNYYVDAGIPIFAGGQYINNWKMAKVNRLMGKTDEQVAKDNLAMTILQDYVDVVYYKGMIDMAAEKLEESSRTFYKTQRQEELGLKSKADVAQTEAQMAEDDYNLTFYENQYNTALLKLKQDMYLSYEDELTVDEIVEDRMFIPTPESSELIYEYALEHNPQVLSADYNFKSRKYQYRKTKGDFFPTFRFFAGVNTSYFNQLSDKSEIPDPLGRQLKNNMGEYFGLSVSVPIFSPDRYTNARKARNNMRIAAEQQKETHREVQNAIEQNVMDREGFAKEIIQMEKQVKSNDLAYRLTLRQYEEGLMSPLDVQTNSNALILSKATLLQKRLMYIIKDKIVNYYKGIPLVEEK